MAARSAHSNRLLHKLSANSQVVLWDDLTSYLWVLWGYARWFLGGGPFFVDSIIRRTIPSLAIWLDSLIKPKVRVRVELVLLFLAVFIAGFLSWRDEHRRVAEEHAARTVAERQFACLARQAEGKQDRAAKKAQLQQFYVRSKPIYYAQLPKDISVEAFDQYVESFDTWAKQTAEWITKNLGEPAAARFLDSGAGSAMDWNRAANAKHNNIINLMTAFRKNLSDLVESDAWDAPNSSPDCRG